MESVAREPMPPESPAPESLAPENAVPTPVAQDLEAPAELVPIMLVEAMDTHGRVHAQLHLKGAGASCKIGRGLTCDMVLDDAFAAAEHTRLTLQADGRVAVVDLGSHNGTRINRDGDSERLATEATATIEDALLIVGRTRLRIRTVHSPLTAEKAFRRDALQRHRTALAIGGTVAIVTLSALNDWLSAPEQLLEQIAMTLLSVLTVLSGWVGVWSAITRITHGIWNVRLHAAIASNATAIGILVSAALSIAAFALQWSWLAESGLLLGAACLLTGLYLHFRAATHLRVRTAVLVAVVAPILIASTLSWINHRTDARDVNHVVIGGDLYPPELRMAHGLDLDEYLNRTAALKHAASLHRQNSLLTTPLADTGEPAAPTPAR